MMTLIDQAPLVRVEGVSRAYSTRGGKIQALNNVSLEIPRGAFVALKGRSGSGKTTLLNIIGGLDSPDRGEIYFDGHPMSTLDEEDRTHLRRNQIGFIFQSYALLPTYSAYENVEFALRIAGKNARESRERALQCIKAVGLLNRMMNRPDELSGGQQQRVAIARAMANRPGLILADEPTGELDTVTTRQMFDLLRRLVDSEGVTLLVTSHDPRINEVADIVYRLKDGVIDNA